MRLRVEVEGLDRVERHVGEAQRDVGDLRAVWNRADDRFNRLEREQFRTEGGLTGGWPPLKAKTLKRKREARGQRTTIMQRSGSLMRGLVNPFNTSDGAVHRMTRQSWERGTSLDYAPTHQRGLGHVPQREIIAWRGRDTEWLVGELEEHATRAFR